MKNVNVKELDSIIDEMIETVEKSKEEIFSISEQARTEGENLLLELEQIREKVVLFIDNGDALEKKVQKSRKRLAEVSKYFDRYSEKEIRDVYDKTHRMQTELIILQQEEKALRQRRDDLERRIIAIDETMERADALANKISVILPYLNDDFKKMNHLIADAKEKQEFSLKVIQAQEEERRKISREVHDGPAQMMANILLRSELVERALREKSVEEAVKEIKDIRKMIRRSLYEVRRIIYDLRPMALDDLGLVPTLKRYITTVSDYNKIKIEFIVIGKEERLPQEYEVAFFRLVQESIQNALKHANPKLIKVHLEINKDHLSVMIVDDGDGFDVDVKKDRSFGIIGMKERVEMLSGAFQIKSEVGKGTRVYINVPLNG